MIIYYYIIVITNMNKTHLIVILFLLLVPFFYKKNIEFFYSNKSFFSNKDFTKYYEINNYIHDKKKKVLYKCNSNMVSDVNSQNCKTFNYSSNSNYFKNIAGSKVFTAELLSKNNIPIPRFINITKSLKHINIRELITLLDNSKLNPPYVIKIDNGRQGKHVYVNIHDKSKLLDLIHELFNTTNTPRIIIEEFKIGEPHRILMYKNKIIDILKKEATTVYGDGIKNILELIDVVNVEKKKNNLPIIDEYEIPYIKTQGFNLKSIIPINKGVILSKTPHYHHGSLVYRITKVHPDNIKMFQKVQNIVGSELLGIDYLTDDISVSYIKKGWINEINSMPDLNLHKVAINPKLDFVDLFINKIKNLFQ